MIYFSVSCIFFLMLSLYHSRHTQAAVNTSSLIRPISCTTPPYCSDAKRNAAGELINQNYFDAQNVPEVRNLLLSVETNHLHQQVLTNFKTMKFEAVLPELKYTLNRFPNHPKALQLLSSLAKFSNPPSLAVPYYEKALRLYPQYALTRAQYGAYLVDMGRISEGIANVKSAIEMDPKLAWAYASLATAYAKIGDQALARQAAAQARALGYSGKLAGQRLEGDR